MSSCSAGGVPSVHGVLERADHQRHDAERPFALKEILQEDDLQLDGVFRQVGHQLVVEQAVAVVLHQPVDVVLVGRGDAERRLEVLARQREAMAGCSATCR